VATTATVATNSHRFVELAVAAYRGGTARERENACTAIPHYRFLDLEWVGEHGAIERTVARSKWSAAGAVAQRPTKSGPLD
jgi:hypothetical protein